MTQAEFGNYLVVVAVLAGALGVVNLLRPAKRWLGIGSICVGFAALLYRIAAPMPVVAVAVGLAIFCMGRDVALRPGRRA